MLNWVALYQCQIFVLLICLASKDTRTASRGGSGVVPQATRDVAIVQTRRLATLCAAIMTSYLSIGVFLLDNLNLPMAALQAVFYVALLLDVVYHLSSEEDAVPSRRLKNTPSFRSKAAAFSVGSWWSQFLLNPTTPILFVQFAVAAVQVVEATFGTGDRGFYSYYFNFNGDYDDTIDQQMSRTAENAMLWTALILGWCTFMATREQQKAVLLGRAAVLLLYQHMLTGSQGEWMDWSYIRSESAVSFTCIVLAVWGGLS